MSRTSKRVRASHKNVATARKVARLSESMTSPGPSPEVDSTVTDLDLDLDSEQLHLSQHARYDYSAIQTTLG